MEFNLPVPILKGHNFNDLIFNAIRRLSFDIIQTFFPNENYLHFSAVNWETGDIFENVYVLTVVCLYNDIDTS